MPTKPNESMRTLTAREFAAIKLRVPSGTAWLDEMIEESRHIDADVAFDAKSPTPTPKPAVKVAEVKEPVPSKPAPATQLAKPALKKD